jgi:hypothetical protein
MSNRRGGGVGFAASQRLNVSLDLAEILLHLSEIVVGPQDRMPVVQIRHYRTSFIVWGSAPILPVSMSNFGDTVFISIPSRSGAQT